MTPSEQSREIARICALAPVIPVLMIDDIATAAPLARALVKGGLPVLEVTLRTENALDAIRAMTDVDGGVVGAGTLLTPRDVRAAKAAGATFGVSPGATARLIAACEDEGLPLMPGAATASEIMVLLEQGYTVQKFFPAESSGGTAAIRSFGQPIPQVRFCATGGVNLQNARSYLALKNIIAVGGSWVAPQDRLTAGDWQTIESLAREAAALRG